MKIKILTCALLMVMLVSACNAPPGSDRFSTQVAREIHATQTARAAGTSRYTPLRADNAARLQTLRTFNGEPVYALAAASRADVMAYVDNTGIHIVDLGAPAEIGLITAPEGISALAVSPDGCFVAGAGSADVYIWSLPDLALAGTVSGAAANALEFSADGRMLYGINWQGVYGWQVPDGKQLFSSEGLTDEYGNRVGGADAFTLMPGPGQILLARQGTTVDEQDNPISLEVNFTRLDLGSNDPYPVDNWYLEVPEKLGDYFASFALSPDEDRLAIGWFDNPVEIWKFDYGFELELVLPKETAGAHQLTFSPDGGTLGIGTTHSILLWDMSARNISASWPGDQLAFLNGGHRLGLVTETDVQIVTLDDQVLLGSFPYSAIKSIRVSPDSELVAVGYSNREVEIWAERGQELTKTLASGLTDIEWLDFSPGGEYLAAFSSTGQATVWNTSNWEPRPFPEEALYPQFTQDGLLVAHGADPTQLLVWGDSGEPLYTLPHAVPVVARLASPTEPLLAVLIEDWTIWLWDLGTGNFIDSLVEAEGVELAGFSGDGRVLVTISPQGVARVWSVANAELLAEHDFDARIEYIHPAPSGDALVAGSYHGPASWLWHFGETQVTEVSGSFDSFSPSGQLFATSDHQVDQIAIWRTADGSQVSSISGYVNFLEFSIDESLFLLQQFPPDPPASPPHLQAISVTGGDVLTDIPLDGYFTPWTGLSADGATLAVTTSAGNAYVWGVP